MERRNPLAPFLAEKGPLILDGGLATELEARGYNLADTLWSARLLLEDPAAIRQVHEDYLRAGADCIISASYQGTLEGFMARGLSQAEAAALLERSVELAREARERFWAAASHDRPRPLVAASVGPYGAALADGSEYRGDYQLSQGELEQFHRQRWHILANSGADLLACETIPSRAEARALANLLHETPEQWAWFTFSCQDERHISEGQLLSDCLRDLAGHEQIVALGINCTAPRFIPELLEEARRVSDKPLIVYPNSGEQYDPQQKCWLGESDPGAFGALSRTWYEKGATLIGGCCRTGPAHISQIVQTAKLA